MKGLMITVIVVVFIILLGTIQSSAQESDITVTVTMAGLSISCDSTAWHIGTVSPYDTVYSTKMKITNTGGITLDFTLSLTNPADWIASSSVGPDTFNMRAVIGHYDSTAVESDFTASDDLTTSVQAASATKFDFTADVNGADVPAGAERSLWLRFQAPSTSTVGTEQSITVTLGCQAAVP